MTHPVQAGPDASTDRHRRTARARLRTGIDWPFVWHGIGNVVAGIAFAWGVVTVLSWVRPAALFDDAILYWRATDAWVTGGDPWTVRYNDVVFAGIPPTLLVNLPLIPFGEWIAKPFWAITGLAGAIAMIRHFRLPPWWLLFPPLIEAWLPGSPDPALAGLAVVGVGAFAALAKPYMIPAMLADGRRVSIVIAVALGVVTLPILPWGRYFAEYSSIIATASDQSGYRSFGDVLLLVPVGLVAIVILRRTGIALAAPMLWPKPQWHYAMLSMGEISRSRILIVGFSVHIVWAGPASVVVLAALVGVRAAWSMWRARRAPAAAPAPAAPSVP